MVASFGCADTAPPPATPIPPTGMTSATTSDPAAAPTTTATAPEPPVTASATVSATASAKSPPPPPYPPKTGVIWRDANGTCGWRAGLYLCPPGATCKPTPPAEDVRCPRSIQGKSKGAPGKLPSELGYLEVEVDGTCWWSKEVPAECAVDTPCAPLPPSHQVRCNP